MIYAGLSCHTLERWRALWLVTLVLVESSLSGASWPLVPLDEVGEEVHGEGEDDGGVLLSADGVQGLQVPQL